VQKNAAPSRIERSRAEDLIEDHTGSLEVAVPDLGKLNLVFKKKLKYRYMLHPMRSIMVHVHARF
jgi:hypothetical protein